MTYKILLKDSGAAFVELTLVLLFLLALALGGLEVARLVRLATVAAGMNRELTAGAFRDCWFAATTDVQGGDRGAQIEIVRECLANVITGSNSSIQQVIPGAKLTLTVYKYDTTLNPDAPTVYGQSSTEVAPPTRVSANDFDENHADARALLISQGVLFYGETFLPYASQAPIIPKLLGLTSGELYNVSAF